MRLCRPSWTPVLVLALAGSVFAGDTETYPEGKAIPRGLTSAEARHVAQSPILPALPGEVPTGPLHCVPEYEPMAGILIAWEGSSSWKFILRQMAAEITTTGDGDIWCVVDSASEQTEASNSISAGGADMSRVTFMIRTTDSIWIRDYGPRYVYEGDCRIIVDHTYNRPRPNDNLLSTYFSTFMGHERYAIPLVHGGGNYHLNGLNEGHATELIVNENPGRTEAEIVGLWETYQGVTTIIEDAFPTFIDSTQHIDMWMQIVADDVVILSDWANSPGSTQDQICDAAAIAFASAGWTVHRIPGRSYGGTHYTYTNMVMCNDLILLPSYTNSAISPSNAVALAVVQAACPDKTVVQINCEGIVSAAGVMHCIMMHIPAPIGGLNPTAHLRTPAGGETYLPDDVVSVRWISDDDGSVTSVDLLLSTDGGQNFGTTIVTGTADDGTFDWTVPNIATNTAQLRVIVHDDRGFTGFHTSDDFTIAGTSIPGDVDGDGDVDFTDLVGLLGAWGPCPSPPSDCSADFDGDGAVGFTDLVTLLAGWSA